MQRVGQMWVVLVVSVLLAALLQGCPGGGDCDGSRFVGTWQGTTSQGKNVLFMVANDQTITTVTAEAHLTGDACTAADLSLTARAVISESIVGNHFSVVVGRSSTLLDLLISPVGIEQIVMTGTFTNESTASGEIQFTANLAPSPCPGTATVTFQARKQ